MSKVVSSEISIYIENIKSIIHNVISDSKIEETLLNELEFLESKEFQYKIVGDRIKFWLSNKFTVYEGLKLKINENIVNIDYLIVSDKEIFIAEIQNYDFEILRANNSGEWLSINYHSNGNEIKKGIKNPFYEVKKKIKLISELFQIDTIVPLVLLPNENIVVERNKNLKFHENNILKLDNLPDFVSNYELKEDKYSINDIIKINNHIRFNSILFSEYLILKYNLKLKDFKSKHYYERLVGKTNIHDFLYCYSCNEKMTYLIEEGYWVCLNCGTKTIYHKETEFEKKQKVETLNKIKNEISFQESNLKKLDSKNKIKPTVYSKFISFFYTKEGICDKCGSPMLVKKDANENKILVCSNFPICKNIK